MSSLKRDISMKKLEFPGGKMWCSSGLGTKIFVCTRARTISFQKSHCFSESVKYTMCYKRGTENAALKTRVFNEKTRDSRGGNVEELIKNVIFLA